MTHHTPAHQHWLSVGGSNYSDKDHFPDMGTTQCSVSFTHNKYNHACQQIYIYNFISNLARSLVTSYDIIPVKRTGSRPLLPFCQPKSKGDLIGGLAR